MNEQTPVVFRMYRDRKTGETEGVIALFPTIPADRYGRKCVVYEHLGQHGGACYFQVVNATRRAFPHEYQELVDELGRIGYNLGVYSKASSKMHEQRKLDARASVM